MIILVIVVIIFVIYILQSSHADTFNINTINVECVVARYNESLSWLFMKKLAFINKFIIYNKGKPITSILPSNVEVISLPNIGRCDHTYLYHIVNKYNELADVTIFVSGRADDKRKGPKILKTADLVRSTGHSVFIGPYTNVPMSIYNFNIHSYVANNPENQINEGALYELQLSKIRPFGVWYNNHWPNKTATLIVYQSTFAVEKKHIIQHPVSYYEELLEEVSIGTAPEVGHYLERAWTTIFSPYPNNCNYYSLSY